MFELLRELARNLGLGAVALVTALVRAGITSSYFIRDTFRAHYNLLGQYTAQLKVICWVRNLQVPCHLISLGKLP